MSIKATQQYIKRGLSQSDLDFLAELDPSTTHKYLPFIVKSFLAGDGLDLLQSRITEYHTLLQRNLCDRRDINSFKKFRHLDEYVQKLNGIRSERELKREAKSKADIILDNENVFIVRPLSHEASCIYGGGTRWCTTAANSAHFEMYFFDQLVSFYYIQVRSEAIKNALPQDFWKVAVAVYPDGKMEVYDSADHNIGRQHGLIFLDNLFKSLCVDRSLFLPLEMDDRIIDLLSYKVQRNVTQLDLSRKGIKRIPENIGDLARLRSLILSENAIEAIPASIGRLTGLLTLHLFHNRITSLPQSIGNLTGLMWLGLSGNMITKKTIRELKRKLPYTRIYSEEMT